MQARTTTPAALRTCVNLIINCHDMKPIMAFERRPLTQYRDHWLGLGYVGSSALILSSILTTYAMEPLASNGVILVLSISM